MPSAQRRINKDLKKKKTYRCGHSVVYILCGYPEHAKTDMAETSNFDEKRAAP
jgi:hypothetical protein